MHRFILSFGAVLTMLAQTAHAQQPDTALVLVHYKFTHVRDTTNRAHPYTENMALYVGKNTSGYRSYDRAIDDAQFRKQVEDQLANSPDGNITTNRRVVGTPVEYYQYPHNKAIVRKEWMFNNYLVPDTLPGIAWHIHCETATFGGLHCQKATAHFKGRDYTAWFCPDLPLHVGPWKLNGLPGVIVEAYDVKKEVVFKFDGVEKATIATEKDKHSDDKVFNLFGDLTTDPNFIQPPTNSIKTTEKQFGKLQAAMQKDPNAFANSAAAAPGPSPRATMSVKMGSSEVINNPIELPEKGTK
jgi:GLPGLI family protein